MSPLLFIASISGAFEFEAWLCFDNPASPREIRQSSLVKAICRWQLNRSRRSARSNHSRIIGEIENDPCSVSIALKQKLYTCILRSQLSNSVEAVCKPFFTIGFKWKRQRETYRHIKCVEKPSRDDTFGRDLTASRTRDISFEIPSVETEPFRPHCATRSIPREVIQKTRREGEKSNGERNEWKEEEERKRERVSHGVAVGLVWRPMDHRSGELLRRTFEKKRPRLQALEWKAAPTRKLKGPPLDPRYAERTASPRDPLLHSPQCGALFTNTLRKRNGMRTSVRQVLQHVAARRKV